MRIISAPDHWSSVVGIAVKAMLCSAAIFLYVVFERPINELINFESMSLVRALEFLKLNKLK